jgi:outer membrane protein OmpA-like peptidoglycan-associated protein/CheY-like chemotaxis protein
MYPKITLLIALLLVISEAFAQDLRSTLFTSVETALAEAREADADVLAPDAFESGMDGYEAARDDFERGRNIDRIRNRLTAAEQSFRQAISAAEIATITLAPLLKTRDDAMNANAATFAAELWAEAEDSFDAATRQLEDGDIRDARGLSEEAETLYRDAELTAIKAQYLSQTRALLAQADQQRVPRYAPKTYARAASLLEEAERELNENRYDTDRPRNLAQQANYEARHAIYLANLISRLRDEDVPIEDIILQYEAPLARIAASADMVAAFDDGVAPVERELTNFVEELREQSQQANVDLSESRARIAELNEEIRTLDEQLGGVSQERVALVQRLEAEARIRDQFQTIETMFTRDEARVSREGNNIVLRLVGLSFASGRAEVDQAHGPLLQKVAQATAVFPRSQIIIEGHTDSYGSDETNMALSRQRADSVSAYLIGQLGIPAFRISAVGYGETRPIANNETDQGRSRNRRIDVLIEPQLE